MTEQQVRAYHRLSMHQPGQYAPGPGQLHWASQPAPFRRYPGTRLLPLWHRPLDESPDYDAVFAAPCLPAQALNLASVSQLLYDSLALSAWKEAGDSRWALRINPSSGNLHPTEAYLLLPAASLEGAALLAHYAPDSHALEVRSELPDPLARLLAASLPAGGLLLALASIGWREAWKYGERAWRYCQHDLGHAQAALAIAASGLGWQVRQLHGIAESRLDSLFGVDRDNFAEREQIDCLLWIGPVQPGEFALPAALLDGIAALELRGQPNRLSPQQRAWPELACMQALCRAPARPAQAWASAAGYRRPDNPGLLLRPLLHQRRSAQAFDARSGIRTERLHAWLRRLLPGNSPVPLALSGCPPQVDLLLFVHRVQGLAPGLYWLDRCGTGVPPGLRADFAWQPVPAQLPLYCLEQGDARELARFLSCGQAIASDGCVALGMLAHFDRALAAGPWQYAELLRECGRIGQLLYLEAETAGLSGTGIGCFFDPQVHELLGIADSRLQSLYHFTLGRALVDPRISTQPAYAELRRPPRTEQQGVIHE